jgi:cyanophycinase
VGYILLAGGAEFRGRMATPDRQAIKLAGGVRARLSIIPAAAAPDKTHQHAGQNGVNWFKNLGAVNVTALPLIDRKSANDPAVVQALQRSNLIYMLGGFPRHLARSLAGSDSWQAILAAHRSGAVIAGSSAGAMVLCDHYYDPYEKNIFSGLGLIPEACILPHHNTFGKRWAQGLAQRLAGVVLIGIDEETAMLDDGPDGQWQVNGAGGVALYKKNHTEHIVSGKRFNLKF